MSNRPFHKLPGSSSLSGIVIAQGASAAISIKVNLVAITNPTINSDSSAGYSAGSLWFNAVQKMAFQCTDATVGAAVWYQIAGGSIRQTVTEANAFTMGQVLKRNGANHALAQANSKANAAAIGLVESASGTQFTLVYFGLVNLPAHGFTVGSQLFLSPTVAGALTASEPSTTGQVIKPVAFAVDADTLLFTNQTSSLVVDYLTQSDNLSSLASKPTSRANLGLGTAAVLDVGTTSNKVVQLDNNGKLPAVDGSMVTGLSGVRSVKLQKFTSSGTYTPSTGMICCIMEAVGGGGAGGGTGTIYGGGSGGYSKSFKTAAQVGASQIVTIGDGGVAGDGTSPPPTNGGDTSIGSLVIAKGGTAGNGSAGAGGIAGTGDLTIVGSDGATTPPWGGASPLFGGPTTPDISLNGPRPGSGGAGFTGGASGGNGAKGIALVTEFCNV